MRERKSARAVSSVDRIEKLIALAGSANEHEARSAAYLACKLIREGGFRLVASAPDPRAAYSDWTEPPRTARRPPTPPDLRPRRPVPSAVGRARRSGRCSVCGEAFEEGSDVALPTEASDSHLGAVHADCRARWSVVAEEREQP